MFEKLSSLDADSILTLMQAYRDDPRPDKIDLGVGIWREPNGKTPVFQAVKKAEEQLWRTQETKAYTSLLGDPGFADAVARLLFGDVPDHMAASATVGGTSAVRQLLALTQSVNPDARVWVPAQTWPNHWALCADLDLSSAPYAWLDRESGVIDRDAVLRDLSGTHAGDIVILHACCQNPTGADPDPELQTAIFDLLERSGAVPLIDAAYLGFGSTPDADTHLIRAAQARLPEVMVAFSGSKSFGLYRERVGLALVLSRAPNAVRSHLGALNRMSFTFPPDHGARCVTMILQDPELKEAWYQELARIRTTLSDARKRLTHALRNAVQSDRFDVLAAQKGMFSLLPLGEARVEKLRKDHGIYMVGDGRINLAGVTPETAEPIARSIASVLT